MCQSVICITCGANRGELKDQSATKGNLSQLMHFYGQTRPYEMRPNKANFGLLFGYFWLFKREEERRRRKE